ncbi:MAG: DNA double-strand break repair nuclease NurA [Desulfurococcaceae archaeon]
MKTLLKKAIEAIRSLEKRYATKPREAINVTVEVGDFEENTGFSEIDYRSIGVKHIDISSVKRNTFIYGLDSSSRVVDTPYSFIAVGASTVLNRFNGFTIDYPDINDIYGEESKRFFTLFIPEFEAGDEELDVLENMNIVTKNPAGYRYKPGYNKSIALDEFRLMLENALLREVLVRDCFKDATLLLDGPLYIVPQYVNIGLKEMGNEVVKAYIDAWITLVSERLNILEKLFVEKNVISIGVVKRINKSNILSKTDPLGISKSCLNDYTYLSTYIERTSRTLNVKPLSIGPLIYRQTILEKTLPLKKAIYIAVPKTLYSGGYRSYCFFRIESFEYVGEEEILNPILYDSVLTGTTMPLTILIADNRVKKITSCLVNYTKAILEYPVETTLQYISIS